MVSFHSLSLDLIDKSNKPSYNKGLQYRYILVIIDNFSRYIFCYPLISKSPSTTSISSIRKILQWFRRKVSKSWTYKIYAHGQRNRFFYRIQANFRWQKIGISKTIPYMLQSNTIVERANGVIKRIINKLIFNHMNEERRLF